MEQTKLTVRLPRDLIEGAKKYAEEHNTTVTRLVAGYFRKLGAENEPLRDAPVVRRLAGVLADEAQVDEYYRYLEEKYGRPTPDSD